MFRWFLLVLVLVAVAAGLLVGVLNPDSVELDFLIFEFSAPLGATVLAALVAGVLVGLLLALVMFIVPGRLGRSAGGGNNGGGHLTDKSDG